MPVIQPRPSAPTALRPVGSSGAPWPLLAPAAPLPVGLRGHRPRLALAPRAPAPQRPRAAAQHTPAPAASAWRGPAGAPAQNLRVESRRLRAVRDLAPAPAPTHRAARGRRRSRVPARRRRSARRDDERADRLPHEDWYGRASTACRLGPVRIDADPRGRRSSARSTAIRSFGAKASTSGSRSRSSPSSLEVVHGARSRRASRSRSSSRPPPPAPGPAAVAAALAPLAASAPLAPAASAFAPLAAPGHDGGP